MTNSLLDLLGYLGSSLDKPGRAVRGLLGGKPEEALAAIPFSDAMGLTDPANAVSGRNLLEKLGALDPKQGDDFDWGDLAGMGVNVATDPLTWAGLGGLAGGGSLLGLGGKAAESAGASAIPEAASLGTKAIEAAASPVAATVEQAGGRVPAMLGLRRQFGIVKDVNPKSLADPLYGRLVGADPGDKAIEAATTLMDTPGVRGQYNPNVNLATALESAGSSTARHEMIHGLIDQAYKTGQTSDLPLLMRAPAEIYKRTGRGYDSGFGGTVGRILDELAAQTLSHRDLPGQIGGAAKFLFNPEKVASYAKNFAETSPLAAKVYVHGSRVPTVYGPGAILGGGGGAGLLYALTRGNDANGGAAAPSEEP